MDCHASSCPPTLPLFPHTPLPPSPGPNDRKLGRQYVNDPSVDETKLLLRQYSLLQWVERFPHWKLTGEGWGRGAAQCTVGCPCQRQRMHLGMVSCG